MKISLVKVCNLKIKGSSKRKIPENIGETCLSLGVEPEVFSTLDKFQERYKFGAKAGYIQKLRDFTEKTGMYKNLRFKGIAGDGGLSIVFELANNEVLKLTKENPFEFRKHYPKLDIPLLGLDKFEDFFLVREAKADTLNVKPHHLDIVLKKMKKCKLEPSRDFYRLEQIGLYKNEPFLLDTRCAMPQPNVFSRFVYDFHFNYRRVIQLQKVDANAPIVHIDETPRANISLKKGLSIIINTIRENFL